MPLSSDPEKRAAQIENLEPGAGAGDGGLQRALSHGGYSKVAAERLDAKTAEIYEALAADAPLRNPADGELPRHDAALVTLLAETLVRLGDVSANIRDFGVFEQRGKRRGQIRPAVELEGRLRREAVSMLDQLGMSPKSRAAMGIQLAATEDLARKWAAQGGSDG